LDFETLLNCTKEESNNENYKKLLIILDLLFYMPKYFNGLTFNELLITNQTCSGYTSQSNYFNEHDSKEFKEIITNTFKKATKEKIYLQITFCKIFHINIKSFTDKVLREIPGLKNMIKVPAIETKIEQTMNSLTDALIQFMDQNIFDTLKKCILDEDWQNAPDAATVSFSLKELTFKLYFFKVELYELLDDEKKGFGNIKKF